MKKIGALAVSAILAMGVTFTSCDSKKAMGSAKLTSEVDSVSFILGKAQASNMKRQMETQMENWPIKGSVSAFLAGVYAGLENSEDSLFLGKDMQVAEAYIGGFFQRVQLQMADENRTAGESFLAENKAKSGVITTESGLQYKVITEGTGAKPKADDVVKIHYTGKFLDGNVFDSSVERGEPLELSAGSFVPGFSEGLLLMPVGSKYTLWIPSDLAYGERGSQSIQPNSTLEFEVELLEIVR